MKTLFSTALFLIAAAGASSSSVQAQPPSAPVAGVPVLEHAATIRVTETSYMTNQDHHLAPDMRLNVTFARPNRYYIAATGFGPDGRLEAKPDVFITNGFTVTEYVAASSQYKTRLVSTAPGFRLSSVLTLDYHGSFQLLPDSFRRLFAPMPGVKATQTETQAQVDGHPARLIRVTQSAAPTVRFTVPNMRLWLSLSTGLPIRYENYIVRNGKEHIFNRIDYTDWALNKPVAPSTFTWTAPPAATVYPTDGLLAVGKPAPDFTAVTADGKHVHLSDFRGRPVVLDFWATWCQPCQKAMPHLESVYRQVKDQNVAVLGVCVWDSKAAYQKWVAANQGTYSFPTAFDTAGEAASNIAQSKYAVQSIPTQYVIDKNGNVASAYEVNNADHSLENALANLGITISKTFASPAQDAVSSH